MRFNIEAAGDCEPEWHAAHVFGHWLADLHSGNGHAKSDEAADAIAELAMLAIFKEIKPCD